MEKIVHVTLDASGLPVPDQDPVFVGVGDSVSWTAPFSFAIEISGLPAVRSASVVLDEPGTYKYSITANGRTNDPEIVVLSDVLEAALPGTEDGDDW
jgi:hypothetical protein